MGYLYLHRMLSVLPAILLSSSALTDLDSSTNATDAAVNVTTIGSSPQYWSSIRQSPSEYSITVGDKISFRYSAGHNVWLMPTQEAFDNCDFSGATELASSSHGGGSNDTPNVYEAVAVSAGTLYIACDKGFGFHCRFGQKVEITVAEAPTIN